MQKIFFYSIFLLIIVAGCKKTKFEIAYPLTSEIVSGNSCIATLKTTISTLDTGYMYWGYVINTQPFPSLDNTPYPGQGPIDPSKLTFEFNIGGALSNNVNYYLRSFIRYNTGTVVYSNNVSFIIVDNDTVKRLPVLETMTDTSNPNGYVGITGKIVSKGGSEIKNCGAVYSKVQNPTIGNALINVEYHLFDNCDSLISGSAWNLEENVTYYARAYAINETGTGYGNEVSFKIIDPYLKHFAVQKGVLLDTVIGENNVQAGYNHTTHISNNLILPQGIDMYIVITDVKGQISSSFGTPNIGDIFKLPTGSDVVFFAEATNVVPPPAYCYFSIKLIGTTYDATYYCKYKTDPYTTNTTRGVHYYTNTAYSCDTQ